MNFFWILWGFDALIALVVVYFFIVGLLDGSVSSYNLLIWGILLVVVALVMLGSLWLKSIHQLLIAKILLWLFATPGILAILYVLMIIIFKPRWN